MKIMPEQIKKDLAAIINPSLAELVVNSYLDMQRRYYASDWKPAELDGGQFCEAIARAIYQLDTNNMIDDALPGKLCDKLLDQRIQHRLQEKDRDHFCRVLRTTYKFRNDRGVAHISPIYNANLLDATLIITNVKWMFAEFLRLAWRKEPNELVATIEAIVQLEHPLIHELDGQPLILATKLSAPEETLVYLHHSSNGRLTRDEIRTFVRASSAAVTMALNRLENSRHIRISSTGEIVITPLGQKRVLEEIMPSLFSRKNVGPN